MGDRANVRFVDDGGIIYFYTHWSGSELEANVAASLVRGRSRWDDDAYLARIVFCGMVKDDCDGTTGFGISTCVCDGDDRIISLNTRTRTIAGFDGNPMSFEEYIRRHLGG